MKNLGSVMGENGNSAYELAIKSGYVGSEEQFSVQLSNLAKIHQYIIESTFEGYYIAFKKGTSEQLLEDIKQNQMVQVLFVLSGDTPIGYQNQTMHSIDYVYGINYGEEVCFIDFPDDQVFYNFEEGCWMYD